jgi:hypothetical protein
MTPWRRVVKVEDAGVEIPIATAGSIAHEAAGQDKLAQGVNRSNRVARRQRDKLMSAADEEDVEADEQGPGIELGQGRKRPAEIALASGVDSMDLLPEQARSVLHVFPLGLAIRQIRIQQHADHGGPWSEFVQQFKSLRRQVSEVQEWRLHT